MIREGGISSFTYETTGELKTVRDALGRTSTVMHDDLGRVVGLVDALGRSRAQSYSVPTAGAWVGPTLMAASGGASPAPVSLTGALRSGDYQIGWNALDTEGYPARISLYLDATFQLGYRHDYDAGGRPTRRRDRAAAPFASGDVNASDGAAASDLRTSYAGDTAAPLVSGFESPRPPSGYEPASFERDLELDVTRATGFGGGLEPSATYTYVRDVAGRVRQTSHRIGGPGTAVTAPTSTYDYRPDGRLGSLTNIDGAHAFTYDARGLLAAQTVSGEGTYTYGYDVVGRNTTITFPDGHVRRQIYDELGRIVSRCYEYAGGAPNRCYTAEYDAASNPLRLTDPEGADLFTYDALDRLKSVTRIAGTTILGAEAYDHNALGALKMNASTSLETERPRLDGAGRADAAVPASLGGQPVLLDAGGRVTSARGVTLEWSFAGYVKSATPAVPGAPHSYGVDAQGRRVWQADGAAVERYLYEGAHRVGVVDAAGAVVETYLFAGVDDPLRLQRCAVRAYYEVDLAGNVRRLRAPGGGDLGGYRYTAFGQTRADTASATLNQPLRWKARPRELVGGLELYDMRARQWSPDLGIFLSIDEFAFHDASSTLWGWPRQNPIAYSDPSGRSWSLDPNDWDDSTQQYFLSGQAERDTAAFFVGVELGLLTGGLANEVALAGFGIRGAVLAGALGGGIASAESDLIRTGCVSATNVGVGMAAGALGAGIGAALTKLAPASSSPARAAGEGASKAVKLSAPAQRAIQKHGSSASRARGEARGL